MSSMPRLVACTPAAYHRRRLQQARRTRRRASKPRSAWRRGRWRVGRTGRPAAAAAPHGGRCAACLKAGGCRRIALVVAGKNGARSAASRSLVMAQHGGVEAGARQQRHHVDQHVADGADLAPETVAIGPAGGPGCRRTVGPPLREGSTIRRVRQIGGDVPPRRRGAVHADRQPRSAGQVSHGVPLRQVSSRFGGEFGEAGRPRRRGWCQKVLVGSMNRMADSRSGGGGGRTAALAASAGFRCPRGAGVDEAPAGLAQRLVGLDHGLDHVGTLTGGERRADHLAGTAGPDSVEPSEPPSVTGTTRCRPCRRRGCRCGRCGGGRRS